MRPTSREAPPISILEPAMPRAENRVEHDLLGDREVPVDAYYGIHTLRARENFPITGIAISTYPDLVNALVSVKQAAAAANRDLGLLADDKAAAILAACEEIRSGRLHEQFIVDVIQGGAGTSANMNANEVVANRALELLGHGRGEYAFLHPIDDVNMGQSTNDVYPTAVKVALHWSAERLLEAMGVLRVAFAAKADELHGRGQDRAHAAAGRRPHDARAGVHRLRGHDRRGRAPARGGVPADRRGEPRRHGHRDAAQHPAALLRAGLRPPGRAHRHPAGHLARTSSRPARTRDRSSSSPACSSGSPSRCPRSATTCACSPPGLGRG